MNRSAYMFGLHGRETAHSVACFFLIKKKSLYLQSCANLATKPHLTFCLCLFHETKQSTKQYCKCRNSVGRYRFGGWCSWPISSISPYAICMCVFQTLMDEVHRHRQESQGGHRSNRARVLGFVPRIGGVAGC